MSKAREAAARAVELARKESASAHVGHGTPDPDVWKLCRRQDGGEVELFVGPMDKMIEAMDASIAKDISNAAIDAFLAALKADGYKLVKREIDDAMFIAADNIMPRNYDELTIGMARYGEDVFYEVIPGPGKVWAAMWDRAPDLTTAPAPATQPQSK